jgi:hypothetical protein
VSFRKQLQPFPTSLPYMTTIRGRLLHFRQIGKKQRRPYNAHLYETRRDLRMPANGFSELTMFLDSICSLATKRPTLYDRGRFSAQLDRQDVQFHAYATVAEGRTDIRAWLSFYDDERCRGIFFLGLAVFCR